MIRKVCESRMMRHELCRAAGGVARLLITRASFQVHKDRMLRATETCTGLGPRLPTPAVPNEWPAPPRENQLTGSDSRFDLSRLNRNQKIKTVPSAVRANSDDPPIHMRLIVSASAGAKDTNPWVAAIAACRALHPGCSIATDFFAESVRGQAVGDQRTRRRMPSISDTVLKLIRSPIRH
jgi:hypothetical protein